MQKLIPGAVLVLSTVFTAAASAALPAPVVSSEWLSAHAGEVVVLDVREDTATFAAEPAFDVDAATGARVLVGVGGHIRGARPVDYAQVRVERVIGGRKIKGMLPDREAFQALMRKAGVAAGRPIVIVAPGAAGEDLDTAARLYWSLKYYGADDLAILDGGMAGWLAAGLPYVTGAAEAATGDWSATAERVELVADSEFVVDAQARGVQLIDARPLPFYLGLQKKPNVQAAGRLEGALNFPPDVRTLPAGPRFDFLPAERYRRLFARFGIDADAPSVTYCNTGHLAAGAWFVLSEILGNRDVRLYDGSMTQWTAEGRPVVALR